MSEDRRKNLRTQGKYGDGKVQKSRDKKQKSSLGSKDSPEMRLPNKNSDDNRSVNNSLADENASPLKYEENSDYTFHQLEEAAKPEEIKGRCERILSRTDSGESRILYDPQFLHSDEGDNYFNNLSDTIQFDSRNIVIHGVEYPQPRLVAWFGPYPYSYSGVTLEAAKMPDVVLEIKEKVEAYLKSRDIDATFNSVLINLYRDGKDSVSWHSDDEMMLGICPTIASVSLGETRKFEMRPKIRNHEDKSPSDTTCKYLIHLTHGSLVVMTGSMQDDWQHRVPKEYHDRTSRINLTFRTVYPLEEVIHLVRKRRSFLRKSWNRTPSKRIRFDSDHLSVNDKQLRQDLLVNDEETRERRHKTPPSYSYFSDEETCARRHKREASDSYRNDEETSARNRKRKCSDSYMSDEESSARKPKRKRSDSYMSDEEHSVRKYKSKRSYSYVSDEETSARRNRKKLSSSYVSDEEICARSHKKRPSDSYVNDEETCERRHKIKPSDSYVSNEKTRERRHKRKRSHQKRSSDSYVNDEETCERRHKRKPSDPYLSDEETCPRSHRRKSSDPYLSDEETCERRHKRKPSDSYVSNEETCPQRHRRKSSDLYLSDEETCPRRHRRKSSDPYLSDEETSSDSHVSDEETFARRHVSETSDSDNTD